MKILLPIIIIFCLIILQSSLYPYLKVFNAFPNLILIMVIILSILEGWKKSLIWVIFGGLLLDIFSFNNPIGASVLGLFIVSYLTNFVSQNIFKKTSFFSIILISAGSTLVYGFFIILVLAIGRLNFQFSVVQMISQMIYNTALLIPIFYLIKAKKREF